jgi:hypothetical protein
MGMGQKQIETKQTFINHPLTQGGQPNASSSPVTSSSIEGHSNSLNRALNMLYWISAIYILMTGIYTFGVCAATGALIAFYGYLTLAMAGFIPAVVSLFVMFYELYNLKQNKRVLASVPKIATAICHPAQRYRLGNHYKKRVRESRGLHYECQL